MIKLLTLKNVSPYAEDALYKICLSLDEFGIDEERFEDYELLSESAFNYLSSGQDIVIAAEGNSYNQLKKTLMESFNLKKSVNGDIAKRIMKSAEDEMSDLSVKEHSLLPSGAAAFITNDGLFSGFSSPALLGRLTFMPLDFMRIDKVLEDFLSYVKKGEVIPSKGEEKKEENEGSYDFSKSVKKLVGTLSQMNERIALVTGEATMWIYNLYSEIPEITEVASFVEIIDENEEPEREATVQSESVRLVGKARDAMENSGCDIGAAISEIYSTENDEGEPFYFAYVAVVDKGVAKAKKLSTTNPDDLELLLPHAVSLLCETVIGRVEAVGTGLIKPDYDDEDEDDEKEKSNKKFSKNMIIFAAAVLVVALIVPIAILFNILNDEPTTTAPPIFNPSSSSSSPAETTLNPFDSSSTTVPPVIGGVTESSAQDISAPETTAAPVSSTKGIFTFYVFGYGHGVGMSQIGANYLAQQGWTAAQILAHYYYNPNTSIITGEKYPEKITYNGSIYDTREYLASALESEMGASFSYEALKAQAIALYTFAKYNSYNLSQDAHAYGKTPSELCYRVVDEVMNTGYYIAYGNDVAVTPFHAMSAGVTTSYYNVWGKGIGANVPYLAGGRKSYGDYLDSKFKSVYTITSEDLKKLVKEKKDIDLSGDPAYWLSIVTHDKAVREDIGYVSSINVGGTILTGNEFRIQVMDGAIRSHCFTIVYTPES